MKRMKSLSYFNTRLILLHNYTSHLTDNFYRNLNEYTDHLKYIFV